jgi:hypothetical protein
VRLRYCGICALKGKVRPETRIVQCRFEQHHTNFDMEEKTQLEAGLQQNGRNVEGYIVLGLSTCEAEMKAFETDKQA